MQILPTDWFSLLTLTFVLGMKHGFDADHLATIDGLTRYNIRQKPHMARYCGMLFSLGHGTVVLAIALGVSSVAGYWKVPEWFDLIGSLISIVFLAVLGCLNLTSVLRAEPDQMVQPIGFKGRWLGGLRHTSHPLLVALVGGLFALSYDTLSQAAFFALTATQFGGWKHALILALLFTLGMLVTDGINGLWIARLIARADRAARVASRIMGLTVSALSLTVCIFGATKLAIPGVEAWSEGKELAFGIGAMMLIGCSFLLAIRFARRQGDSSPLSQING